MKPSIELFLLTSTTCNLGCKTCPGGRKEHARGGVMSLEMLDRILDKGTREAKVLLVQLYFLNEPLLIPHFPEMVELCHKYKVPCIVSTNLNVFKNVKETLAAEPERLIVSVSGFTQPVYERSHRGGNIDRVKEHLKSVALLRSPKTEVQVSYHRYKYNEHEMPLMRQFAKSLGLGFFAYGTSILPQKLVIDAWMTGSNIPGSEDLLVSVQDAKALCWKRRKWDCLGQDRIVGVDSRGVLIHCNCDGYDLSNERGNLFETTIPEFLKRRKTDPECIRCKAVGAHIYGMQAWSRPQWSPTRLLGTLCRRLKIDGIIEPSIRRYYGRKLLPTPKT